MTNELAFFARQSVCQFVRVQFSSVTLLCTRLNNVRLSTLATPGDPAGQRFRRSTMSRLSLNEWFNYAATPYAAGVSA